MPVSQISLTSCLRGSNYCSHLTAEPTEVHGEDSPKSHSPLIIEQKKSIGISEDHSLQVVGGLPEVCEPLKVGTKSRVVCQ